MTGCAASTDCLERQRSSLEESNEVAKLLSKLYTDQVASDTGSQWPHCSCALKHSTLSRKYSECCASAHNVIRASCSAVYKEEGLEPYRSAALQMGPEIEESRKLRAKMLTDFDSYKRRLKALEAKKVSLEVCNAMQCNVAVSSHAYRRMLDLCL